VDVTGTLDVSAKASLADDLDVTGKVKISSTTAAVDFATPCALSVAGGAFINANAIINTNANVGGILTVTGESHLNSNVTVVGNVAITGDFTVSGTVNTVNTETLSVKDASILLANGNTSDMLAFGVEGEYVSGGATKYAGFKRIPASSEFVFFDGATSKIQDGSAGSSYAVVVADSFNCASDARLKKDVVPLESALDKIDSIRGVHYHWIDENQSKDRQVGVIAQEIQAVYPELVMEGGNGYLSVDYPKLTAVLIQSIKELKAMVLALANK
jgi:hypothetical protein